MSTPTAAEVPGHQTVRSVVKATTLLLLIADNPEGLAVADAAREAGMPLTTAYHLLNTLLAEGMLTRNSTRRYKLGPKVATLAVAYAKGGPSEHLLSAVRKLSEATGETAYLSGWREGEVVALATIEGSSAVRVGRIHSELRGMEHARASGKLMLAYLSEADLDEYLDSHPLHAVTTRTITDETEFRRHLETIRERGYSLDEGEFTEGVGCVSAPIFQSGTCYGCLTVSAPLERFRSTQDELKNAVVDAAERTSN